MDHPILVVTTDISSLEGIANGHRDGFRRLPSYEYGAFDIKEATREEAYKKLHHCAVYPRADFFLIKDLTETSRSYGIKGSMCIWHNSPNSQPRPIE